MSARDVVVVGGGPAGAATALWLARAGYDVELLERRVFPREKACGDCVSPGANALLRRMDVWEEIVAAGAARLSGWTLSAPSATFTSSFADVTDDADAQYAFAIARDRLDAVLLEGARRAGVSIRTRAHVTRVLRESDGRVSGVHAEVAGEPCPITARLTVGADGLRSRVGRSLGAYLRAPRLRKVSFTAHVRGVSGLYDVGEMHLIRGACLGVAPVQSGSLPVCNVTVVVQAQHAPSAEGAHAMMRSILRRFRRRDLSDLITDDVGILASGPFDWQTNRITFDGAALVGDAAGYYDPFTGQGIFQALTGGALLAEHAAHALRSRLVTTNALAAYAAHQRALVRNTRRLQRAVEYVCARPKIASTLFSALRRTPAAADRLLAVTGDLRPARDLLSPALLTRLVVAVARQPT